MQSLRSSVLDLLALERAISGACGGNPYTLLHASCVQTWHDAVWALLSAARDAKFARLLAQHRDAQLTRTRFVASRGPMMLVVC